MFLFDCTTSEDTRVSDLIGYLASATFQRIFCERLPERHLDVRLVPHAFSRRQPARRFQILRRDAQCHGLESFAPWNKLRSVTGRFCFTRCRSSASISER